jgi:hypothetical protein
MAGFAHARSSWTGRSHRPCSITEIGVQERRADTRPWVNETVGMGRYCGDTGIPARFPAMFGRDMPRPRPRERGALRARALVMGYARWPFAASAAACW